MVPTEDRREGINAFNENARPSSAAVRTTMSESSRNTRDGPARRAAAREDHPSARRTKAEWCRRAAQAGMAEIEVTSSCRRRSWRNSRGCGRRGARRGDDRLGARPRRSCPTWPARSGASKPDRQDQLCAARRRGAQSGQRAPQNPGVARRLCAHRCPARRGRQGKQGKDIDRSGNCDRLRCPILRRRFPRNASSCRSPSSLRARRGRDRHRRHGRLCQSGPGRTDVRGRARGRLRLGHALFGDTRGLPACQCHGRR